MNSSTVFLISVVFVLVGAIWHSFRAGLLHPSTILMLFGFLLLGVYDKYRKEEWKEAI